MATNQVENFLRISGEWLATPFRAGMQTKKRGVDCINFAYAIFAETFGLPAKELPRFSPDSAYHSPVCTKQIMQLFISDFGLVKAEGKLKGFDLLILKEKTVGRGHHVALVGPYLDIWDAISPFGVRCSSKSGILNSFNIVEIWRKPNAMLTS